MSYVVAVVGATGVVGREMIRTLESRAFPIKKLLCFASPRSAGTTLKFHGKSVVVQATDPMQFKGVDFALFSAGAAASKELAPQVAAQGAVVIDNSSAWRMDFDCPLVIPEVNPEALKHRPKGIIANPNCSTIQMLVALKPLHDAAQLQHIVVSTYQAASGKGHAAIEDLRQQTKALVNEFTPQPSVFPGVLAMNLLSDWKPAETALGYSEEEVKMVNETHKILNDPSIHVSPTCVRVPVENCHSEAIYAKFSRAISVEEAMNLLSKAPGLYVDARPYAPGIHPQPIQVSGHDQVWVGRVRQDFADASALNLWVVGDNLRKGAALNAVQIAEELIR